jgi:hypothetical protein
LRHPVFRTFVDPYFRLSDPEMIPVLIVQMDDREASLPLHALMAEFGIRPQDDDGRMLALVIQALSFVTTIEIGSPLPLEILTGEASWVTDDIHRDLAVARVNLHLLDPKAGPSAAQDKTAMLRLAENPVGANELNAGLQNLAKQTGRSATEVRQEMNRLVDELAYIEALREWLLHGAIRMDRVLIRLTRSFSGDSSYKEILSQTRRLTGKGIEDMEAHFARADHAVANLATAIADTAATITLIRSERDLLHRRWKAWEPYCREWATVGTRDDTRTRHLAHETYRFLAPRYMTVVEWRSKPQSGNESTTRLGMTW